MLTAKQAGSVVAVQLVACLTLAAGLGSSALGAPTASEGSGEQSPRALASDSSLELQVGGVAGIPGNAAAAVLNVTATNTSAPGFLTVWPCGEPRPEASNVNYVAGQSIPNLVVAKLGTSGKVCIYSMSTTDVVVDASGYFPASADYEPIPNPIRVLDTRTAATLAGDNALELQMGGVAGIPGNAAAAVLNVTATNTSAPGFLTVWPCGEPRPEASNVNYVAGQSIPNLVVAKLGTSGKVCIYSMSTTDVVVDASGYFPASADYEPIPNPIRVLDTRTAATLAGDNALELQMGGVAGIPGNAAAAVLNVTATNTSAPGFLTVWPCGEPRPEASNVNYVAGQSIPNLVVAKLGTSGKVCIYSMSTTDVVVDASGYFPASADYEPIPNPIRILDTRTDTGGGGGGTPIGPPGDPGCGLGAAAFCDTFDSPVFDDPSGPRNGPLSEVWGISRTRSDVNAGQNVNNQWLPVAIEGCGPTSFVNAPSDVRVCNGRLYEASNDGGVQTLLAMYPKQPFNWAGRTGRVVFDASTDTMGSHGAWGEFWITDQPIPTPTGAFVGGQAPYIRNGVGFTMALDKCNSDPNLMSIDRISVIRNYVAEEHFFDNASAGCIHKVGPDAGALNHFEVRVSANRFEVYGTNPGSAALILLAGIDNPNLTLPKEQGLIWISDGHYNASEEKTGYPGGQHIHTFAWDNVGFDGPKTYRDLSFDVPDALVSSGDGVNLGYAVSPSQPVALTTMPMYRAQEPTGALVTYNWYAVSNSVPSFRVNGGPWHDPAWPFTDGYGFSYRALGVSIPAEETRDGPNTIEFRVSSGETAITNVNLILIAGAPVP